MKRMSRKAFFAAFLLVALLVAGFGSYYASAHPDGLNVVADKTGFSDQEKSSGTSDGPLAGYETKGIDDARLSGGVAGVVGCLLVLTLAGGLAWAVRRRGTGTSTDDTDDRTADVQRDRDTTPTEA